MRGTPDSTKVGGSLFVLSNNDTSPNRSNDWEQAVGDTTHDVSTDTLRLAETLAGTVAHLRRQLEQANKRASENRRVIAALTTRTPELPSALNHDVPPNEPESSVAPSEHMDRGNVSSEPQEQVERRSLLYRIFFGSI
jgi:hypothetical protein